MTTWPVRGGPTDDLQTNEAALDAACRVRAQTRRIAAALVAVLAVGAGLLLLARRIDAEPPAPLQGDVRHATVLQPR